MVQKDRRARITHTPNANLGFPKPCLEISPVLLICVFDVGACLQKSLKDEVLDQVSSRELGSAGVEGLKDLLGVLIDRKIDHHQPYELSDDYFDRRCTLGDRIVILSDEPLPRSLTEVSMGFHDLLA